MPKNQSQDARSEIVELATILAIGIVRLKSQPRVAADTSLELSKSAAQGLEFTDESRLSVTTG